MFQGRTHKGPISALRRVVESGLPDRGAGVLADGTLRCSRYLHLEGRCAGYRYYPVGLPGAGPMIGQSSQDQTLGMEGPEAVPPVHDQVITDITGLIAVVLYRAYASAMVW